MLYGGWIVLLWVAATVVVLCRLRVLGWLHVRFAGGLFGFGVVVVFVCLCCAGLTILCLGIVLLTLCAWWFGRGCYSFGLACGFHFNSAVVLRYGTACVVVGLLMGVCILVVVLLACLRVSAAC